MKAPTNDNNCGKDVALKLNLLFSYKFLLFYNFHLQHFHFVLYFYRQKSSLIIGDVTHIKNIYFFFVLF